MKLIDQRTKKIMEECKVRARDAGLSFLDETLEYIVTNRDMLELSPKNMIPTFYDYWVHDLQVFREKKLYEIYPYNPYETVINTRPAISFYNDNNPDWLNVMIFYHVLAHIDFFQNNLLFRHTWNDDFAGVALADKRLIASLKSEKGRFVDYVIEFARGIDNLVGYYEELSKLNYIQSPDISDKVDFYFGIFLGKIKNIKLNDYFKEIDKYNYFKKKYSSNFETFFFSEIEKKHPEFEALYAKEKKERAHKKKTGIDLLQYINENSKFVNDKENNWMKPVLEIVRRSSVYFEPQRRTKIMNEGWASYWHEKLFLNDERIKGHEVDFARINAKIMSLPRAGLNPYALGWRMFMHTEELSEKGKISFEFQKINNTVKRKNYNKKTGKGLEFLFNVRENFSDFTFINVFVDQDFINTYDLFLVGKRLNADRGVWEYYVKSRNVVDYKKMLIDSLYHPPHITIEDSKDYKNELYLYHHFEGRPLVKDYISNTMLGIEYLTGTPVHLETSEIDEKFYKPTGDQIPSSQDSPVEFNRVRYTMKGKQLTRQVL
jgi:stage V sporulation protein R